MKSKKQFCDDCKKFFPEKDMYDCYGMGWICQICLDKILDNSWKVALEIFGGQQKLDKYLKEYEIVVS